jgi:uncharacterized protein (DUF362 family)
MPPEPKSDLNRREFIGRCAKAGLAAATAGAMGYGFYDAKAPDPSRDVAVSARLPDFSIPDITPRMAIARGSERADTVHQALNAVGGIAEFVKPGDRVLLKPNVAFAAPPILSATTHPELVNVVARLCFEAGAAEVIVTDNPINDPASCFALTGIEQAARDAGARVVLPGDALFSPLSVPGGRLIREWPVVFEPFRRVSKVIGLAPLKDHHRSGASMCMKNWYGLLGGRRNIFHQDIHTIITELAVMMRPTLVILDATTTMMTNGPTGGSLADLKQTDTLIVSTDQVAADAFGATLLGLSLADLPFIARAEAAGVGTADYEALEPVYVNA